MFQSITILRSLCIALALALAGGALLSASAVASTPANAVIQQGKPQPTPVAEKEEGLSSKPTILKQFGPVKIGGKEIGPFSITNSMVVTWACALLVIGFAQIATSNIKQVPSGLQNFWEMIVEGLFNFLEDLLGHHLVKKTFWFFATIFIFIVPTYWFSLIPGVGTIGWGHYADGEFHIIRPLLRGPNSDLNMTMAIAFIFFALWILWALQEAGPGGMLKHIFAPKGEMPNMIMKFGMIILFFMIGLVEIVSILFRPISLSFRLYGNAYAGESMIEILSKMNPWLAWLTPIPFYLLEFAEGLIQAFVFMLLCAVFTLMICKDEH